MPRCGVIYEIHEVTEHLIRTCIAVGRPPADGAQRRCHSRGQNGGSILMEQALTSLLVFAVLHYVFKPVLDDGAETLGDWLGRRSVARQERRQRRSTNESQKAADSAWP